MNIQSSILRPVYFTWTYPFINLPMLQLNKSGTNGCNVALLIGEGYSPCPFRILELRICVNPSITDSPVQTVHDHGKLHWKSNTQSKVYGIKAILVIRMHYIYRHHTHTQVYLHVGDEGHLLQRLFSSGLMAGSHPLQSHCHLGSKAGSGPTKTRWKKTQSGSILQ